MISELDGPFHDDAADAALYTAFKTSLRPDIRVKELDCVVTDPQFAEACAQELLRNLGKR